MADADLLTQPTASSRVADTWQELQELKKEVSRSLRLPDSAVSVSELGSAFYGKSLAFDAAGALVGIVLAAGDSSAALAAALAATTDGNGAELVARSVVVVTTVAKIKALNFNQTSVAVLSAASKPGVYVWTTGDFSAHCAADTVGGVYAASNLVSATVGCWIRLNDGTWWDNWFGVPTNAVSDCGPATSVYMNVANIAKPHTLKFGPNIYHFDTAIPNPTYCNCISGSIGPQPTVFNKRYLEGDTDRGLIARTNHGGRCEFISFQASDAASGGSLVSAKLATVDTPNIGELSFFHCNFSGGSAGANRDLLIDGTINAGSAKGYRQVFITNCKFFGGTGGASRLTLELRGVQHAFLNGCLIQDKVRITGTAAVPTDDIQGCNIISAVTALELGTSTADNVISRVKLEGSIQGAVVNFSGGNTTWVRLGAVNGLVSRNWDTTTCGVETSGSSNEKFRITNLADLGTANFGTQGKIQGQLKITASGTGQSAGFNLKGASNAVTLLYGDAAFWSTVVGTAGRVNIFYNASGYYGIENRSGGTLTFSVEIDGSMVAF